MRLEKLIYIYIYGLNNKLYSTKSLQIRKERESRKKRETKLLLHSLNIVCGIQHSH